jgi:hypothetical protein
MRLPRFRFTLRRLMVAVAIAGFAFAAGLMWQRSAYYRSRAEYHASKLSLRETVVRNWQPMLENESLILVKLHNTHTDLAVGMDRAVEIRRYERLATKHRGYVAISTVLARYHSEMTRKYRRLAVYPWLPVEPDPPEPKFLE